MNDKAKIPTLVDNLNDNTLLSALRQLLSFTQLLDIATGTFEIGSLLSLDGAWQPLERIRLLMGDETTRRTRQELVDALRRQSEAIIEAEKERDDARAVTGLQVIRQVLDAEQISVRTYSRANVQ